MAGAELQEGFGDWNTVDEPEKRHTRRRRGAGRHDEVTRGQLGAVHEPAAVDVSWQADVGGHRRTCTADLKEPLDQTQDKKGRRDTDADAIEDAEERQAHRMGVRATVVVVDKHVVWRLRERGGGRNVRALQR